MLKDNHARRDKLLAHIKALVYDKGPMTAAQLAKDLKINSRDRKLIYAIQTLKAVGVIESNGSLLAPARRELSKHDYELAYNHSCKLSHCSTNFKKPKSSFQRLLLMNSQTDFWEAFQRGNRLPKTPPYTLSWRLTLNVRFLIIFARDTTLKFGNP